MLINAAVSVGLFCEAALVVLILQRKAVSAYPLLFFYSIAQFFANVSETLLLNGPGRQSRAYHLFYWTDEMVLDTLLFLTVIALTSKALSGKPHRATSGRLLTMIAAAGLLLPFLLFYGRGLFTTPWFIGAGQVLQFGAAIMNLVLWTALIGMRPRDPQLLLVSAGVGLAATGAALFYGIFPYTSGFFKSVADLMLSLTQVLGVLICCWAFWQQSPRPSPASGY